MMIQWFTLTTLPLASTDTQNLTHTQYLSKLRQIYCAARNGHSKASFQGNTVNIIRVTLRLKYAFSTFLSTITSAKGQTHFSPPAFVQSLSPTDPDSSEPCVRRGEKEKRNCTCPFPLAPTPLPRRNRLQSSIRKTALDHVCVWGDLMYCTKVFGS